MNFQEYIEESKKNEAGVFACINPDKASVKKIEDFVKSIDIDNPLGSDKYHVTIVYSKTACPDAYDYKFDMPMKAKFKEWKKFFNRRDKTDCLVMVLDCPKASKAQKDLLGLGCVSDFPDYHAHITLSYDFNKEMPKIKPDFEITFNEAKVKPLDDNWSAK